MSAGLTTNADQLHAHRVTHLLSGRERDPDHILPMENN